MNPATIGATPAELLFDLVFIAVASLVGWWALNRPTRRIK